jgi:GT2 family glycosyltransferase
MDTRLKLSVVIPTYQNRELTLRCLAALWLCNPQPDEVIIVDNGSSDNTAHSVLRKYPRHIMVRLPKRRRIAEAANHGLARASGDLLLLLDTNTEVDTSAVEVILDAFSKNENLGVAGAALRRPDGRPQWSGGKLPSSLWCFANASGLAAAVDMIGGLRWLRTAIGRVGGRVDWVSGTAMVMRRSLWQDFGPFDLGYRLRGQYLDVCVRAADAGWNIEVIPEFGVVYPLTKPEPPVETRRIPSEDEILWKDMLRFASRRDGNTGAQQSSRALLAGGKLRLLGRWMAAPLVPQRQQGEWRAKTVACAKALRAIERLSPAENRLAKNP